MSKGVIFWLSLLFLFSGAAAVWSALNLAQRQHLRAGAESVVDSDAHDDEEILKDFTLTERSGEKFHSKDLEGQVWVASFFFASCPGNCRAQNMEIMALQNKYAKKGVKFVSITCDPKNDTSDKLRAYADTFHAKPDSWFFLTGNLRYIERIGAEMFNVPVKEQGHSERLIVVDKWSNVRGYYDWKNPVELVDMKQMLDQLVSEEKQPEDVTPKMPDMPPVPGSEEEEDEVEVGAQEEEEEEGQATEQSATS